MLGTNVQWKPFYDHERLVLADIVLSDDPENLLLSYPAYSKSLFMSNGLHAEGWFKNLNGRDRYIMFDAAPIYNTEGKVIAAIETLQDITERKLAEDLLKEEKNKAQKYLDTAGVMIVALDSGGRITLINKKGLEILGYEEHEVINQNWFELCIPGHMREEVKGVFNELMAGDIELIEYHQNPIVIKDGGERIIAFHNTMLRNESGEIYGVLSSGEDITEQRRNSDELYERVHQAALAAEIGVVLTRGGDLRTTLQLCAEGMVRYLEVAFARIWTLNEIENVLEMQASAGTYTHLNGAHSRVPVNNKSKIGLIAEERKPHLTNQVIGDSRVSDQEWVIKEGMVAFAGYPLIVQDRLVGVMAMFSRRQIAEATMSSLASVADVIALGIERKKGEESLASYSRELTALNTASNTLMLITNLGDIYQEICNTIYAVFDLTMVWIGIIEEGGYEVRPVAHCGYEDDYLSAIRVTWDDSPTGMGPSGMAIKTKAPAFANIDDPSFAPWREEAKKRGYVMRMAVPLMYARDKCIGVLNFYSSNVDYFNSERTKLCQIFANQAAIAIENVRLIEELEGKVIERTKELEDANQELQSVNRELVFRREEAETASRSKTDFLANMSHELRTPLNVIMGFSDIMQTGMAGPVTEKQKEFLNDIYTSGEHLLTLITDILDLSKIEAGKTVLEPETFTVKELIDGSLLMFKEKILKHHIKATAEIDNTITDITADKRKLKQVVVNLLSNAFKFTPDGGSVHVAARRVVGDLGLGIGEKEPIPSAQPPTPDRDFIEISVSDTGIGISKKNQQRLFQPFQQIETSLTRKYAGTGLGLSLCRRFIELHGGRIWVESEPGKGSRFVFIIPMNSK
jgi:PAS domain S-box-containing protein